MKNYVADNKVKNKDKKDGNEENEEEEEIYEAMKKSFTHPEIIEKIKQNTKESYKKFDSQKIYNQVSEIFEQQYQLKLKNERS